ncbi:hypothetical protein BD289DRAFT_435050 [Coniella lustricola]|uniref:Secreted protein n=1 Tax=Coniella lustricola TaxID=2025994 RepID=A0A2T3A6W7_9PEZI|nr:hypothetical protein BD289DRAFT_435050 [Coniella lustricola]
MASRYLVLIVLPFFGSCTFTSSNIGSLVESEVSRYHRVHKHRLAFSSPTRLFVSAGCLLVQSDNSTCEDHGSFLNSPPPGSFNIGPGGYIASQPDASVSMATPANHQSIYCPFFLISRTVSRSLLTHPLLLSEAR